MALSIAQQTPPQVPPAKPAPPSTAQTPAAVPAAPVQGPYEFTSEIGAFLIVVKTDKAPAFDAAMAKLKQAFAVSNASSDRKRQAAGWRILKSTEATPPVATVTPGAPATMPAATPAVPAAAPATPPPTITYLFLIEPVAKKTSYDPIEILRELLPNEVQAVYDQLKDSWVSATRIGLTELMKMGGS